MLDWSFSPSLVWAVVGLVLLIAELATVSFILCFIGLGALIVALTTWLSITPSFSSQLIVFTVSSLLLLFLLRKTAGKLFAGQAGFTAGLYGAKGPRDQAHTGRRRGSDPISRVGLDCFSDATQTIPEGAIVQIESVEGIRVKVKPVK